MGIEANFVLPVKDHLNIFTCAICSKMASLDCYVTLQCQHCFCKDCFKEYASKFSPKAKACDCPNCGTNILANNKHTTKVFGVSSFQVRPLSLAQPLAFKILGKVKILCPNRTSSSFCSWTGDYEGLEDHVSTFHSKKDAASTAAKISNALESSRHGKDDLFAHSDHVHGKQGGKVCLSQSEHVRDVKPPSRIDSTDKLKPPISRGRAPERSLSEKRQGNNDGADSMRRRGNSTDADDDRKNGSSSIGRDSSPRSSRKSPLPKPISPTRSVSTESARSDDCAGRNVWSRERESADEKALEAVLAELERKASKTPSCDSNDAGGKSRTRSPMRDGSKRGRSSSRSPSRDDDPLSSRQSSHGNSPSRSRGRDDAPTNQPPAPSRSPRGSHSPSSSNKGTTLANIVSGTKEKANAAFKEGRYKDAIILYSEATDSWVGYSMVNSPSPAEKEIAATLYGNRAAAYLKEELFDLCLHDCESAISLNPNLYRAHIRRAWVLREQGRYEEACASLKKALLDNPNVEELKEELDKSQKLLEANVRVKVMLEKGQYTRVKQILASVEQNNKTTLFLEARAELGLGKSDIVLEKIKSKVLDDDLTNVEALTLVAQAHFQNGDFDKATQQVKNALRYGKDSSEAKDSLKTFSGVQVALSIGRNELEKKNYDRAIQGFTRAINGCNKLPVKSLLYLTLHSERAQAYRLANKLEECLEDTKKALASDGECVKTWIERVKAFQALRDFDSIVHELGPIVHKFSNKFLEEAFDEALSPPATVDFYDLFEVPRTATVEEIKKQYKLKARESHPDRFTSQSYSEEERKEAEEKFKLLGEGLELLSDSFQRSLYDTGHSIDTIRMRADALKRRQASQRHATATAS